MCEVNTDDYYDYLQQKEYEGYGEFIATDDDIDLKIDLYRENLEERGKA